MIKSIPISWEQLDKNTGSKELSFESFNFQIAYFLYSSFGRFEYDYATPGSEFYLILNKDCEELKARAGDVIGWQAKFWLNKTDPANSTLDKRHRDELVENFGRTLIYKSNLKRWIICTPGKFSNTKTRSVQPKDELVQKLNAINSAVEIDFWFDEIYNSFRIKYFEELAPVFYHYFSQIFVGFDYLKTHSDLNAETLKRKFDTDLYVGDKNGELVNRIINVDLVCDEWRSKTQKIIKVIKKNNYFKFTGFINYDSNYTNLAKTYLVDKLGLAEKVIFVFNNLKQDNFTSEAKIIIDNYREDDDKKIAYLNKLAKKKDLKKNVNLNNDEDECNRFYIDSANKINKQLRKINSYLKKAQINDIHFFGEAGKGKTNLSCSIYLNCVNNNTPAILMLGGSDFINADSISGKILKNLELHDISFNDFLSIINSLGVLKRKKIPIIIDGLNESMPSADIWNPQLNIIISQIRKFENLLLVTTCRNNYVQQVFGTVDIKDVENSYLISGFNDVNIRAVTRKYFDKYNVKIANVDPNLDLLKDPLLLKIFSFVNAGKILILDKFNIYQTVDSYIEILIKNISTQNKTEDPLLKQDLENKLKEFTAVIWNRRTRSVSYDIFLTMFNFSNPAVDPNSSISFKIIDEGLFTRKKIDNKEFVEFTYDLIAGFFISKFIFSKFYSPKKINFKYCKPFFKYYFDKIFGNTYEEDIIKSLIYFFCTNNNFGSLFRFFKNSLEGEVYLISMKDIITSTEDGQREFEKYFSESIGKSKNTIYLLESILVDVLDKNDYKNINIIKKHLLKFSQIEIDLIWSEIVRKNSSKINEYLEKLIIILESGDLESVELKKVLLFVTFLFSTTNRLIRDKAASIVVKLGGYGLDLYFSIFKEIIEIRDSYIQERAVAALYGSIMRIGAVEYNILKDIAKFLEDKYFYAATTTDSIILDNVTSIIDFSCINNGYIKNNLKASLLKIKWRVSRKSLKNGHADWGYGPVNMDFTRDVIENIASYDHDKMKTLFFNKFNKIIINFINHNFCFNYIFNKIKTPNKKDCLALIVWKIKKLGYRNELFAGIDEQISKRENYSSLDHLSNIERYQRKYSWIAFYELKGLLVIKNLVISEYDENTYRMSNVKIDPSFPEKPKKTQFVSNCFLPTFDEDVQNWINKSDTYFDDVIESNLNGDDWILLNADFFQEDEHRKIRIRSSLQTFMIINNKAEALVNLLKSDTRHNDIGSKRYYDLFAGEIFWSAHLTRNETRLKIMDNDFSIHHPYSVYTSESYDSKICDIGDFPFISKQIAEKFNLRFNLKDLSAYTRDSDVKKVTTYLWDDYSYYLFIRKDFLFNYLKDNNLSIVHYEFSSKYGSWGEFNSTKYKPTYSDCKNYKILNID